MGELSHPTGKLGYSANCFLGTVAELIGCSLPCRWHSCVMKISYLLACYVNCLLLITLCVSTSREIKEMPVGDYQDKSPFLRRTKKITDQVTSVIISKSDSVLNIALGFLINSHKMGWGWLFYILSFHVIYYGSIFLLNYALKILYSADTWQHTVGREFSRSVSANLFPPRRHWDD